MGRVQLPSGMGESLGAGAGDEIQKRRKKLHYALEHLNPARNLALPLGKAGVEKKNLT